MVVVVLTDASLATAQQPVHAAGPSTTSGWRRDRPVAAARSAKPYDWDKVTGHRAALLAGPAERDAHRHGARARPQQQGRVDPVINEKACAMRS